MQLAFIGVLRSPAVHFDFNLLGQFPAQVIDMDARAAVHQRGIFACEHADSHSSDLRSHKFRHSLDESEGATVDRISTGKALEKEDHAPAFQAVPSIPQCYCTG